VAGIVADHTCPRLHTTKNDVQCEVNSVSWSPSNWASHDLRGGSRARARGREHVDRTAVDALRPPVEQHVPSPRLDRGTASGV